MTVPPTISYAQRFEDLHLLRCFGEQPSGFYIDIGAGHPVVDNVSFAFYLRGWRGVTVEPNPHLARLARAVRPRDIVEQCLVGEKAGESPFFVVEEFHGFSTMIAGNAEAAQTQFGKGSRQLSAQVTTLAALCAEHAPGEIEFLKIDVEGAEGAVVRGGDWKRFRPKVVLLEALAPYTLAPAWDEWEPLLLSNGYRYAFFDSLNRYYVAEEAGRLAQALADAPAAYEAIRFAEMQPALEEPRHPDYRLAELLARAALIRMPLLDASQAADLLAAEASAHALASPATDVAMAAAWERVFGRPPLAGEVEAIGEPPGGTLQEFYARLCASEAFRVACGRISGSYAW